MKYISTQQKNKRGQTYNTRSTRIATGYSKMFAGHTPEKFLRLAVYGTFDTLAKQRFDFIWINIMHPTDSGYIKRTRILNRNKRKYMELIPIDERKIYRYRF